MATAKKNVPASKILNDFDFDALLKSKARASNAGSTDMVAALRAIDPNIELLEVGQTAQITVNLEAYKDKTYPDRAFLMAITSKIGNLCMEGREWAGRVYQSAMNTDKDTVYVLRKADEKTAKVRKAPVRAAKAPEQAKAEGGVSNDALVIEG